MGVSIFCVDPQIFEQFPEDFAVNDRVAGGFRGVSLQLRVRLEQLVKLGLKQQTKYARNCFWCLHILVT